VDDISLQERENLNLAPFPAYFGMLVISSMCSLLIVKFSFVMYVENLLPHNSVLKLDNI
jgi:hypothetical protein